MLGPIAKDGGLFYKDCTGKCKTYKGLIQSYTFLLRMAFVLTATKRGIYKFKTLVELDRTMSVQDVDAACIFLTPSERKTSYNHFFSINQGVVGDPLHIFGAQTLPEKHKWMTAFEDQIKDLAKNAGKRQSFVMQSYRKKGRTSAAPKASMAPDSRGSASHAGMGRITEAELEFPEPIVVDLQKDDATNNFPEDTWFVGKMSREQLALIFSEKLPDGAFLVRESTHRPGEYSMSISFGGRVKHIMICRTPDGGFAMTKGSVAGWPTIQELVGHFKNTSLKMFFKDLECTLAVPIKRVSKHA